MSKVISLEGAVEKITDGSVLMIGGFMGVGTPPQLIDELVRQQTGNLTIIANDTARPNAGIGKLVDAGLVAKLITSHIGTNPITQQKMIAGEIEVELVPQGTLAERIRAGGCGLGAVVTPTGVGTLAEEGQDTIEIDGKTFILAKPLKADFALVNAKCSDYLGNLTYNLTARNFNPLMAMAAQTVLAEPASIVPTGALAPDLIATPHVIVDYLVRKEQRNG
ncbi:acetate CoA/acetoacetate CoA-transferase alpha subunit [Cohaesibacter sp. ES.047]|uniref:CoA transferase subunit A n=1 Tax=Cohaesibacter sp. ES.047 TaxID=1798205 RepID=UPI000BB73083|nr:3-oxoacid CoA-transferase subunit A [Cohaesibacter sp. ES.047]SNY94410.1 acetate CoA/acetoacetate CoA-transferase alpha subunit [Cohaesibacter sp. ES.047]